MHLFVFRVYPCLSSVSGPHMWFVTFIIIFEVVLQACSINTGTLLVSIIASALHSAVTPEQMCAKDHL